MKKLLLYCLFSLALNLQNARAQPTNNTGDSLVFAVKQVCTDSIKGTVCRISITPELIYDFIEQYPFYRLRDKKWRVGEQFQLEFTHLPKTGTIYLFSLDAASTPTLLPPLKLSEISQLPLIYPEAGKGLTFELTGTEVIGLWYSSDSISNVDKLIKGLELTIGSSVKRNNRQLGKRLLLPNYGWHFLERQFGLVIEPKLYELPERYVIPIILELEIFSGTGKGKVKKK